MSEPEPTKDLSNALRTLGSQLNQMKARQEDVLAMNLLPVFPQKKFLPWTDSAIRPSSLLTILNEVIIHNREVIVECGSGISTLYLSLLCANSDKQLISIDHDASWQNIVAAQAKELGVSLEQTKFVSAPMKKCDHSPFGLEWYDTDRIITGMPNKKIDLLLVDGPLACHKSIALARYPALPFFINNMATDFAVFLDDCNRPGEKEIAQRWASTFKLSGHLLQMRGNICLLHPPKAKRYNIL